jgi:pimeloyl-ACP methyl ester carboxylesterase
VAQAVRQIIRHCQADPACAKDKPDLEARVDALARRWLQAPQAGKDGRAFPVEDFAQYMMDEAYDAGDGAVFAEQLQDFTDGNFKGLAEYDEERSPYIEGQHLTHLCKEQFPFESREKTIANAAADPLAQVEARTLVRYFDVCRGFPVGPIDRAQGEPVSSPLPILIVNSDTDPGCPPALARAAVKRFPRGKLLIVANSSHGVTRSEPCAAVAAQGFLRDPSAPLTTSCTGAEKARLSFEKP